MHRVSKVNQNAWSKVLFYMNTELRKKAKNDFQKYIFKLMKSAVFEIIIKNFEKT